MAEPLCMVTEFTLSGLR